MGLQSPDLAPAAPWSRCLLPGGASPRRLCSLLEPPSPAQAAPGPPADRASTSQAPLQGPLRSGCHPSGLPAPSSSEVSRPLGPGSKAMGPGEDLRHPTLPLLLPQPGSPSPGGEAAERGNFRFSFVPTDRQTDRQTGLWAVQDSQPGGDSDKTGWQVSRAPSTAMMRAGGSGLQKRRTKAGREAPCSHPGPPGITPRTPLACELSLAPRGPRLPEGRLVRPSGGESGALLCTFS